LGVVFYQILFEFFILFFISIFILSSQYHVIVEKENDLKAKVERYKFSIPENCPKYPQWAIDIVSNCLIVNENKRKSADELLSMIPGYCVDITASIFHSGLPPTSVSPTFSSSLLSLLSSLSSRSIPLPSTASSLRLTPSLHFIYDEISIKMLSSCFTMFSPDVIENFFLDNNRLLIPTYCVFVESAKINKKTYSEKDSIKEMNKWKGKNKYVDEDIKIIEGGKTSVDKYISDYILKRFDKCKD
jgi:hypothetical protein